MIGKEKLIYVVLDLNRHKGDDFYLYITLLLN